MKQGFLLAFEPWSREATARGLENGGRGGSGRRHEPQQFVATARFEAHWDEGGEQNVQTEPKIGYNSEEGFE